MTEKDNTPLALPIREQFVNDIRQIIAQAQQNAVCSVDFCRVQMYWHLGKRILEKEQQARRVRNTAPVSLRTSRNASNPNTAADSVSVS